MFKKNNYRIFTDIETGYKLKSAWFFLSKKYELNFDILDDLQKTGHEIAFHSDNHDSNFAYLNNTELDKRLSAASWFFNKYKVKGFRAPAFLHTLEMYKSLSKYFIYDCSFWDTCDTIENLSNNNSGCCTVFPFKIENVVVLPTTIPQDWVCSSIVGKNSKKILQIQLEKYNHIKKVGGLVNILTHPEPGFSAQKEFLISYNQLLKEISNDNDAYFALPFEVADWWRERERRINTLQ